MASRILGVDSDVRNCYDDSGPFKIDADRRSQDIEALLSVAEAIGRPTPRSRPVNVPWKCSYRWRSVPQAARGPPSERAAAVCRRACARRLTMAPVAPRHSSRSLGAPRRRTWLSMLGLLSSNVSALVIVPACGLAASVPHDRSIDHLVLERGEVSNSCAATLYSLRLLRRTGKSPARHAYASDPTATGRWPSGRLHPSCAAAAARPFLPERGDVGHPAPMAGIASCHRRWRIAARCDDRERPQCCQRPAFLPHCCVGGSVTP